MIYTNEMPGFKKYQQIQEVENKESIRRELSEQVDAWLKAGNKINCIGMQKREVIVKTSEFKGNEKLIKQGQEIRDKILNYLRENPGKNKFEVAENTRTASAGHHLLKLKIEGLIELVDKTRPYKYMVKNRE